MVLQVLKVLQEQTEQTQQFQDHKAILEQTGLMVRRDPLE
jgi:hypothetical protein